MEKKVSAPALISHTVLVHAGSYKDFLSKLTTQYPDLHIRFVKRVAIHYYILQLEDGSKEGISKQKIYDLPIMALREEFSSYIFFKNTKSYNNVLKRMCKANEDEERACYLLTQHMMTPFEKSVLLNLEEAQSITYTEGDTTTTSFKHEDIVSMNMLNKLFGLEKVEVDRKEKDFVELAKTLEWKIGIH